MSTFSPTVFSGKRFAVVGLGKNGLPVALGLRSMGADVVAWDDNPAARQAAVDAMAGPGDRGAPVSPGILTWSDPAQGLFEYDALVLSPGIPHRLPKPHPVAERAIAAGVPILSDVELLFRAVRASGSQARFAGITGTNGKSTTTALLAHILERAGIPTAAGANLGPPALSLPLLPQDGVYVLEMSSYMLERLASVRFDAAVMLNLSPDHIDRHGDMAGYAKAKRAIFDRQTAQDLAVIGSDDPLVKAQYVKGASGYLMANGVDSHYYEERGGVHSLVSLLPSLQRAWNDMLAGVHFNTPEPDNPSPLPTPSLRY